LYGGSLAAHQTWAAPVEDGRLSADDDLRMFGVTSTRPEVVENQAERIQPLTAPSTDVVHADFSIDDADTKEVDDALSITRVDGHWQVDIDIADPTRYVEPGDPIDTDAYSRAVSLYLPTGTVSMLPQRLGYDLASLVVGQARPAIRYRARLNDDGELLQCEVARVTVRVTRRLDYENVDHALIQGTHEMSPKLAQLDQLSKTLRTRRRRRGAQVCHRPAYKVQVVDEKIHVGRIDWNSPARRVVAEMMILCNRAAAGLAARSGVPILYRVQERSRDRAHWQPQPGRHVGLGVDGYCRVTSPLRRFADLATQRQLSSFLAGQPLPYKMSRLAEMVARASSAEEKAQEIEEIARRRWTLEHLARQRGDHIHHAVVTPPNEGRPEAMIVSCGAKGSLEGLKMGKAGQPIDVIIQQVVPRDGILNLRVA
jgi:exoribonuclease-2